MLNPAHKQAYLQALDGVDHEIDKLSLASKQHTANARSSMGAEQSTEQEEPPEQEVSEHAAGVDPHTGEENPEHQQYKHGAQYDGKGNPGGHSGHPFGQRGGMSRTPLFGKRFTR